ncbi:MAG: PTS sugar transporter subunit IIA, partial [Acidobacteriota bacterium]
MAIYCERKGTKVVKLSDYISQELIDPDMETSDMEECLERLVGLLDRGGLISDPRECLQKLLDREKMMSTGIGSGLAIPHAKSEV